MSYRTARRLVVCLAIAVLITSLMTLAFVNGFLLPLRLQSSDLLFRLKPDSTAKWAVLVAIDDRLLAELRSSGRFFNWPRDLHARVIENLKAAGARIIVWDVLFDAPAAGDEELAQSIRNAGNVVLVEPAEIRLPPTSSQPFRFADTIQQLPAFREAAVGIGHANVIPDIDGVIRATPLVIGVGDQEMPALPFVAAAKFLRRPQVVEAPISKGRLPFAGREIPVDPEGKMWISYLGDSSEVTEPPTFPRIAYVDALNNAFSPDIVRGKIAFVGLTGTAFADDYWTPVSRYSKMDGVEVLASAFETIMRPEQFIVPAEPGTTIALIYLAGLVSALSLLILPPLGAAVIGLGVVLGYLAAAVYAVDHVARVLDLPFPILTLGFCYLAILMYRVIFEQAQQRALKGALSLYLSPDVMEEVARDPSAIKLGGEKREMTVLFADIRGFTSLSERLEPETLVHILNQYLARMSDLVFKHEGTVDKYMGDAIMAFWGAPKQQPDHARQACLAALEMVAQLEALNADLERQNLPRLDIGIGLNSGPMAVGNMGSERRFDFTVLGDAVKLGSRLESLNKEYGTSVIASDNTLTRAGDDFRARFLDLVAVKGKSEPSSVYELISVNGFRESGRDAALAAYERGLAFYSDRDFEAALECFQQALQQDAVDGPSAVYVERCRSLLAEPPPADWDGVYVMEHK